MQGLKHDCRDTEEHDWGSAYEAGLAVMSD